MCVCVCVGGGGGHDELEVAGEKRGRNDKCASEGQAVGIRVRGTVWVMVRVGRGDEGECVGVRAQVKGHGEYGCVG